MWVYYVSRKQRMETIWGTVLWLWHSYITLCKDKVGVYGIDQAFPKSLPVAMGVHCIAGDTYQKQRYRISEQRDSVSISYISLPSLKFPSLKSCLKIIYISLVLMLSVHFSPNSASIPTICCFKVTGKKISIQRLQSYSKITSSKCPQKAVM